MPTAAVALNRLHAQLRPHSSSSKAAMREYHLAGGSRKPPPPDGDSGPLLRRSSHAEDGTDNKFGPQFSDTRHYVSASTGVGKTWLACDDGAGRTERAAVEGGRCWRTSAGAHLRATILGLSQPRISLRY